MGSRRAVAGNILAACLALLGILGYLPWLITAFSIVAVAILAIIPFSSRKIDAQPGAPSTASIPSPPTQTEPSGGDQHAASAPTRPIQRLPQVIIEALRPTLTTTVA